MADRARRPFVAYHTTISGRHPHPRDHVRDGARRGDHHRFHAAIRWHSYLVRLVVGQHGRLDFRTDLVIRFDCGISVPWVNQLDDEGGLQAVAGPDMLVLRTPVPLRGDDLRTVGEFSVAAGETVPFVLSHGPSHRPRPKPWTPNSLSPRPRRSGESGRRVARRLGRGTKRSSDHC